MPTDIPRRPVVVGVDGSPSSLAAAGFAADIAVRREAPLHLIYGYEVPTYGYLPIGAADRAIIDDGHVRQELDDILATTAKQIRQDHPKLTEVEAKVLTGSAAAVLIEASRTASVTVVGCRGVGGFMGLLLGSVSAQVSAHGHGPVIVVRPPVSDVPPGSEQPAYHPPAGPIVVGVDQSLAARAAVHFAVDEALARDVTLIAVHVHRVPAYREDEDGTVLAEGLLAERLLPYAHQHRELKVERRAIESANVEKSMIEATRDAGLVVVGCRGSGGFAGLLLGSVSRVLVHHAYAPVAVIHPSEH